MIYHCPFCGDEISEDIIEDMGDIGCPSCRRTFDWEDYESDKDYDGLDTDAFGNCFSDADPGL